MERSRAMLFKWDGSLLVYSPIAVHWEPAHTTYFLSQRTRIQGKWSSPSYSLPEHIRRYHLCHPQPSPKTLWDRVSSLPRSKVSSWIHPDSPSMVVGKTVTPMVRKRVKQQLTSFSYSHCNQLSYCFFITVTSRGARSSRSCPLVLAWFGHTIRAILVTLYFLL